MNDLEAHIYDSLNDETDPEKRLMKIAMIKDIRLINEYRKENPLYDIQILTAVESYKPKDKRKMVLDGVYQYDKEESTDEIAFYRKGKQVVAGLRGSDTGIDWGNNYFNLIAGIIEKDSSLGDLLFRLRNYADKYPDTDISLSGHSRSSNSNYYLSYILARDYHNTSRVISAAGFNMGKTDEGLAKALFEAGMKIKYAGQLVGRDAINNLINLKVFDAFISKLSNTVIGSELALFSPNVSAGMMIYSAIYTVLSKFQNLDIVQLGNYLKKEYFDSPALNWIRERRRPTTPEVEKMKETLSLNSYLGSFGEAMKSLPAQLRSLFIMVGFSYMNKQVEKAKFNAGYFKRPEFIETQKQLKKALAKTNINLARTKALSADMLQWGGEETRDIFKIISEGIRDKGPDYYQSAQNLLEERLGDAYAQYYLPLAEGATTEELFKLATKIEKFSTKATAAKGKIIANEAFVQNLVKKFNNRLFLRNAMITLASAFFIFESAFNTYYANDAKAFQELMRDGGQFRPKRKYYAYNIEDNPNFGKRSNFGVWFDQKYGADVISEGSKQFFADPNNRANGMVVQHVLPQNILDSKTLSNPHDIRNFIPLEYRTTEDLKNNVNKYLAERRKRANSRKREIERNSEL